MRNRSLHDFYLWNSMYSSPNVLLMYLLGSIIYIKFVSENRFEPVFGTTRIRQRPPKVPAIPYTERCAALVRTLTHFICREVSFDRFFS
jgi:hypothetical protein